MQSVAYKNDISVHLHFLLISLYPYFNSFHELNSATVINISVILGRFRSMLSVACKNDNFAYLHFSNYLPSSIFLIHFQSITLQLLEKI